MAFVRHSVTLMSACCVKNLVVLNISQLGLLMGTRYIEPTLITVVTIDFGRKSVVSFEKKILFLNFSTK